MICVTRRTPLAAYVQRCKDVIMEDGYRTLHLYALGAAIPHLLLVITSLPSMLPFSSNEISTEVQTASVPCTDEVLPTEEDEEEQETTIEVREKSSLQIVLKIRDGERVGKKGQRQMGTAGKHSKRTKSPLSDESDEIQDAPSDDGMSF
jgi:hypothetical protein